MKRLLIAAMLMCTGALAAEPGQREAVALAERGAAFVKLHGKDEMIRKINTRDPEFNSGALYLAMRDLKGINLAHPNTALIGKNMLDVPDADGKLFRYEMMAIANGAGHGWVEYRYLNPATGKVEAKTTYVLRVGDVALEAGVYRH